MPKMSQMNECSDKTPSMFINFVAPEKADVVLELQAIESARILETLQNFFVWTICGQRQGC